ncbi:MAG TPA: hypothetical protein VGX25_03985 [Actinophytocola sp.]|uniref:hypothetical protein n=1 Tax=Actinophytocola sp. TaxID=1872138 RepID=UPI002DDD61C2|nr:hypothetical protein [Actinophytocola sp.]HEV2778538.1 hypothetical protein [Actinophytocola sp.]
MDAVLTAALQSLPSLGVMGGVGFVLLLLLRREASTEERHTAELKRITAAHDAELAELKADLADERRLRRELEAENRDLRRGGTA